MTDPPIKNMHNPQPPNSMHLTDFCTIISVTTHICLKKLPNVTPVTVSYMLYTWWASKSCSLYYVKGLLYVGFYVFMHACQSVLRTVFSLHSLICLHRTITVQFIKLVEFIHCVERVEVNTNNVSRVEIILHI